MNFNGYEVIDYEVKKHKLCSAKLAPDGGLTFPSLPETKFDIIKSI